MAFSSFEERVDLSEVAVEIGVKITNTTDLIEAIKVGRSCLPIVGKGLGMGSFENTICCGCFPLGEP